MFKKDVVMCVKYFHYVNLSKVRGIKRAHEIYFLYRICETYDKSLRKQIMGSNSSVSILETSYFA